MGTYQTDRAFADSFINKQRNILRPIVGIYATTINIADFETDVKHAGDLTVFHHEATGFNIGCRVRRPEYVQRFGLRDFTLRSLRDSGVETELSKIMRGEGAWFAYFHSDEMENLPHWVILDLEGFRRYPRDGRQVTNADGTFFRIFRITEFPVGILIAASQSILDDLPPLYAFAAGRRQRDEWRPYGRRY